ncbi:MAG TPA: parallel beta-helix domain-containing protein [Nannocystis sp.]
MGACSGGTEDTAGTDTDTDTDGAALPEGCDALVEPSDDDPTTLQGALLDAPDNSTVCMAAGTYRLNTEISISGEGVTLRGASRDTTILDFSTLDLGANGVKITGDNVTIKSLTVQETPGDGIRAEDVTNVTYDDVAVLWAAPGSVENGAYGFYPVGCTGVTIRKSLVVGARDAGIYVGQSTDILVEDNEAHGNVAGIEIENSTGATVRRNHAHDNTAGILIFNLPGLPVKDGKQTLCSDNKVENNNLENFAKPGTIVSEVPPGLGFMILASDRNEIRDNTITGHRSTGVIIAEYSSDLFEPFDDEEFDIYAQGNFVHHNMFADNGTDPAELILGISKNMKPAPDMMLDGCVDDSRDNSDNSLTNCFFENGTATYLNFDLCGGLAMQSSDLAPVTCEHPPLMSPM